RFRTSGPEAIIEAALFGGPDPTPKMARKRWPAMSTARKSCDGLLPDDLPSGTIQIDRQLPLAAPQWGRIVDLSKLEPGDLVLTRPMHPNSDFASLAITSAQQEGGFPIRHAQWTHAAVYLRDDEHICEANIKSPGYPNGVVIRSAFEYCDGTYAMRARRPKNMTAK